MFLSTPNIHKATEYSDLIIYCIFKFSQEARLSLIPAKECKEYSEGLGFLPKREICAASRYTRRIDAYIHYYRGKRKKPRANRKCPFCPRFRRLKLANRVKDKEIKYGKTDSCSGDSGGPLWKWMGKVNTKANSSTFTSSRISNSNDYDPQLTNSNFVWSSFFPIPR